MRSVRGLVIVLTLWAMPLGAAGQTGKPPGGRGTSTNDYSQARGERVRRRAQY